MYTFCKVIHLSLVTESKGHAGIRQKAVHLFRFAADDQVRQDKRAKSRGRGMAFDMHDRWISKVKTKAEQKADT